MGDAVSYLILVSEAAARARSEAACGPVPGVPGPGGSAIWGWQVHPTDGRAALNIPATPAEAGLGLSQAAYDAMLTNEERAALVAELPEGF